ncbi:phage regulatory protein [Lactobacillus sp. UMNPBX1]|uniref:Rha family transcriptional regulator n=1 Tax=Lactobacillus sp. UMNPBX1 TaxID=2042046 RepID=UPI000BEEEFC4|nr:Rha family transcriptional regulator [Lactobacillus sp. UMNPBX1]PEH12485.1 phage regulatory protein [Lactobacillus sp. UMNPBX1]
MNDLVIMKSQKALTTSLKVAETFGKNHRNVLRSIKNLTAQNCAVKKMFAESTYVNDRGQEQPMYYMNRDGFTLLAMGFTGRDAMRFKLEYIEAFNRMDELIRNESSLPQTPEEKLQLTMVVTNRLVKRVGKVEARVDHIEKTSELSEIQRYQLLQARKKRVIEAVGGVDSNYYKDTKARKVFSAFGKDFKKEFQIPRYDSLEKQYFEKAMEFTRNWYPDFVLQREIQNANAQTSLKI